MREPPTVGEERREVEEVERERSGDGEEGRTEEEEVARGDT